MWTPLCWMHAVKQRRTEGGYPQDVLIIDGVVYIDRGRAGGGVVCDLCGKQFYDHPRVKELPFLTKLCDGTLVKL